MISVVLVCALVALLVWLLLIKPSDTNETTVVPGGSPISGTEQDLNTLSQELHQPVYWAGTMPGTELELSETDNGYPFVRYLTTGADIGDPSPDFLTVGTYPVINAFSSLRSYAAESHARSVDVQKGGIAVPVKGSPTSVYVSYPHEDVQVEVYDPHPRRALNLVKTGVIRPVSLGSSVGIPG